MNLKTTFFCFAVTGLWIGELVPFFTTSRIPGASTSSWFSASPTWAHVSPLYLLSDMRPDNIFHRDWHFSAHRQPLFPEITRESPTESLKEVPGEGFDLQDQSLAEFAVCHIPILCSLCIFGHPTFSFWHPDSSCILWSLPCVSGRILETLNTNFAYAIAMYDVWRI